MARWTTTRSSVGHRLSSRTDDAGFSLVEALVSFVLFTILSVSATWGLVKTIQISGTNRDRTAASNLAQQELEKMRFENQTGHQLDSTSYTVTQHGTTYTVSPWMYPDPHVITDPSCDSGNTAAGSPTPTRSLSSPTPSPTTTSASSTSTSSATATATATATRTPVANERFITVQVSWGSPSRSTRVDSVLSC